MNNKNNTTPCTRKNSRRKPTGTFWFAVRWPDFVCAAVFLMLIITAAPRLAFAFDDEQQLWEEPPQDISALQDSVSTYRAALEATSREREPQAWAKAQHDLADAMVAVAKAEPDNTVLQQAVTGYREALKERTRERTEQDWAITQSHLG